MQRKAVIVWPFEKYLFADLRERADPALVFEWIVFRCTGNKRCPTIEVGGVFQLKSSVAFMWP